MFKQIHSMPPGTVGFEAVGEIDDDDFEDVVAPVLRQQIASGHKLRLLYLLGPQLREYEGDARTGIAHSLGTGPGRHTGLPGRRSRRRQEVGGRRSGSWW
jgi:hypothetical protein